MLPLGVKVNVRPVLVQLVDSGIWLMTASSMLSGMGCL